MDQKSQMRSGTFWNMMGSGMAAANTVILSMLVGHFFDLTEVGMFSLALTTAQVLYSLALFGANDLQMTDYGHKYRFTHYFWVKVFSTVLTAAACVITVGVLRFDGTTRSYTLLLTAFMLVNSLAELYQSLYFQNRRLDLTGKSLFYRFFISTAVFVVVFVWRRSIIAACVWMLAADIAATAWWALRYAKEYRDSDYKPEAEPTRQLLKAAFPLCMSVLGSLLIVNGPKYMIDAWLSDEVQGVYSLLFMPTYAINLLSQFVFKPFLNRYAEVLQEKKGGFRRLFLTHTAVVLGFALFGACGMWLLGPLLLKILFGQDLSAYRMMMFLFVISGGILALNQLLYYIMVILRKQKLIFCIYFCGMAVTLLAGAACVRTLSVAGAWISFTAGQLCLLIGYLAVLHRYFRREGKRSGDEQRE